MKIRYMSLKHSQLCLRQIHSDWKKSFDLEKILFIWGQKQ